MIKKENNHRWWLLPVVSLLVIAGLVGYYLYPEKGHEKGQELPAEKPAAIDITPSLPEQPIISEEKTVAPPAPAIEAIAPDPSSAAYAMEIKENISEFFHYLDQKKYIQGLRLEGSAYSRFKVILKKLAAKPPVPAADSADAAIIISNIYHFFRVLNRNDLQLIKEVILNEQDMIEINMEMFYKWFTLRGHYADQESVIPSRKVLYQYAGFFLTSTGGRAYLLRRSSFVRVLVNYYCILLIHEADTTGKNNYGIDIFPYIAPLKDEIRHYPELQFQNEYSEQLNRIENYYLQKR